MTASDTDATTQVDVGPAATRDRTELAILDVVFAEAGPLTRVDIASRTGLSKPTVNAAVRRMEQDGLLAPAGMQTGRQGRVATYYELAATAGAVLAVELNPTGIRVAVSDLLGLQVSHDRYAPPHSPEDVARQLEKVVAEAADRVRGDGVPLRAIAVSVAKPVDPRTHTVIELPDTPYPEGLVQPAEILADQVDVPLLVDNDVNLAALGELHAGIAQGVPNFAFIYVGAGIGCGIVLNGQLMRGSRGLAGEIGYLPSRVVGVGERHGLARAVAELGLGPRRRNAWYADTIAEGRALLAAAERGEPKALAAVAEAGRALGEAAMAIAAVTDPELIVFGGPTGANQLLIAEIERTLDALSPVPTAVAMSELGESAPLHGALELARGHARRNL